MGFGEAAGDPGNVTVPGGVLTLVGKVGDQAFYTLLSSLPGPPTLSFRRDGQQYTAYRFGTGLIPVGAAALPATASMLRPGDVMPLPSGDSSDILRAAALANLPELTVESGLVRCAPPPISATGLSRYSLLGLADDYEARVVEAKPLLGDICHSGQATVWYAPPNAGKTLIGLSLLGNAVQDGRVQPGNVYYINADDSSEGFVTKMRLMEDLGVHTLAPGQRHFESATLIEQLQRAVREDTAAGIFIIIDTLKKFADLMNKAQTSAFADACRHFVMGGGTILAFAHTNKNPTASGKLIYAGTADIVQDFDAAYLLSPADVAGDRLVRFDAFKRRGAGTASTAFKYAADDNISYEERLLSVHEVNPEWMEEFDRQESERDDAEVIEAVKAVVGLGLVKKMELAKAVAKRISVSERRALKVLEAYTGTDAARHHWTFATKARGAKVYAVLEQAETPAAPDTS